MKWGGGDVRKFSKVKNEPVDNIYYYESVNQYYAQIDKIAKGELLNNSKFDYVSGSFIVGEDTIGISHRFFVKVKNTSDFDKLLQFAAQNEVKVLNRDDYMPKWYILRVTDHSSGDALDMANRFFESGTSLAAPHVAAIAGLILSRNPSLSQDQVRDIIETHAQKVGGYSYTTKTGRNNGTHSDEMGYGLVNALASVEDSPVTMSGPDKICSWTSTSTFSLSNISNLSNISISWSSDGVTLYGPNNNGTSWDVRMMDASTGGNTTIKATITVDGKSVEFTKENVRVGSALLPNISASVYQGMGNADELCEQTSHQLIAADYSEGNDNTANITAFDWDFYNDPGMVNGYQDDVTSPGYDDQGADVSTMNYYSSDNVYFKLRGYNSQCGYGGWKYYTFDVISCGGGFLMMSPNPADDELSITSTEPSLDNKENGRLEIYNNNHSLIYSEVTRFNGKAKFDISDLPSGDYVVHIKYKGKTAAKHLILE